MMVGLVNIRQAKDYTEEMDRIIDDFQKLLDKYKMDALEVTVKKLKQHMCNQFKSMRAANVDTILGCVKDPKCVYV